MAEPCCGTCRFWLNTGLESVCRARRPCAMLLPASGFEGPRTVSFFPPMQATGWCGEHKPVGELGTVTALRPVPDDIRPDQG